MAEQEPQKGRSERPMCSRSHQNDALNSFEPSQIATQRMCLIKVYIPGCGYHVIDMLHGPVYACARSCPSRATPSDLPTYQIVAFPCSRLYSTMVCIQNAMHNRVTTTPSGPSSCSYSNRSVCACAAVLCGSREMCIAVCGMMWPFYSILGLSHVASSQPS